MLAVRVTRTLGWRAPSRPSLTGRCAHWGYQPGLASAEVVLPVAVRESAGRYGDRVQPCPELSAAL